MFREHALLRSQVLTALVFLLALLVACSDPGHREADSASLLPDADAAEDLELSDLTADAADTETETDDLTAQELPEDLTPAFACGDTLNGELDPYGGWAALQWEATGFFRVAEVDGRWWLVTPDGHPFFSTGINGVGSVGSSVGSTTERPYLDNITALYGDLDVWSARTLERLHTWGFNTLGAWSEPQFFPGMPYTTIVHMSGSDWLTGNVVDYWSPEFEAHAAAEADRLVPMADDPWLIGYFVDNEIRWGPDHRGLQTLFEDYLAFPAEAPGKLALVEVLRARYDGRIAPFNLHWGTALASFDELLPLTALPQASNADARADDSAFLSALAIRFFQVTTAAGRAAAPNHLNLGVRFVGVLTPAEVVAACGTTGVDVCSVNYYRLTQLVHDITRETAGALEPKPFLENYFAANGRPIIISEFGFRAADSGLPNTWPPIYPTLDTQQERAEGLAEYALHSYESRFIVGYHWFNYIDQPAEGRFDGENNNWGVVNIQDVPYDPVVETATWFHQRMYPCMQP